MSGSENSTPDGCGLVERRQEDLDKQAEITWTMAVAAQRDENWFKFLRSKIV